MRYGFVLDQNRCIGCHACTVACKEENGVALGVFRTWVKYVEKGTFPDTQRHFAVLRCNHCDDAPCITICPTRALFRRPDGIVDFDRDACIGCKACMQACPYDAIHIDPATNTAAKCHFCAHRVERGLEPACVIVCPEQAIITGDLDDPLSRISSLVSRNDVRVRKPEQGTNPKVFYLGADEATLTPGTAVLSDRQMSASQGPSEAAFARQQAASMPMNPVLSMARVVYDTAKNRAPWGWKVAAYLWTKSIAAGAMGIAAILAFDGRLDRPQSLSAALLAVVFALLTSVLLVLDLKRPERFLLILTRPNRRSWLFHGAWILMAFTGLAAVWLLAHAGWYDSNYPLLSFETLRRMAPLGLILAVATASYSAFLFGQAEGRDFWQSPLLFFQLIFAALLAGAAALLIVPYRGESLIGDPGREWFLYVSFLRDLLTLGIAAHGLVVLLEVLGHHPVRDAHRAARYFTHGAGRNLFWFGVIGAGTLLPLAWLLVSRNFATPWWGGEQISAILALSGLWLWEHLWIKAGQSVPLS